MPNSPSCQRCGTRLDAFAPEGMCPRCLLHLALGPPSPGPAAAEKASPIPLVPTSVSSSSPIRFGDYELLEEIGHGGMGLVYKARQRSLNRVVALKLLLPGPFSSPEMLARFRREAQAAAALAHPGIVPVYEVGELDGQAFFSMEYIAGRSLAGVISELGARSSEFGRMAWWMKGIAEAIAHAHAHGIVHRDLKPANVLVDPEDRVHVVDFGLAKRLDEVSDLTLTGQVLGSPDYLAPEQASGKHTTPLPASDIYATGAILYELLTGRPPFRSSSVQDTLLRIRDAEPVAPRLLNGSAPRDLEVICLKCLEKDPTRRYATAGELADELDRFLKGEPIRARPIGQLGKTWRWCRRKPALAAMTGAAIGLLLAVAVVSTVAAVRIAAEVRRAQENARELRLNLYVADMNLAYQAIVDNNLKRAHDLILKHLPQDQAVGAGTTKPTGISTAEDLRGWEWRYLWRQCQGDSLWTFRGHSNWVMCALFSPDGKWLATASFDQTVRIWDVAEKRALRCLTGFARPLQRNSAAFSPDGALLAVADGTAMHIFDVGTWDKLRTLPNQTPGSRLFSLPIAFSADGENLWCNANGELRQWNTHSWEQCTKSLASQETDFGSLLALSADGRQFATATEDAVVVWDALSSGTPKEHFRMRVRWPQSVAFSPDAKCVAVVGNASMACIWDAKAGREVARLDSDLPTSVAFSPDGSHLATATRFIRLWELERRALTASLKAGDEMEALVFSPDGRLLASGHADGTARLWAASPDVSAGRTSLRGISLGFSADSRVLAILSTNSTVEYWDVRSGNRVRCFTFPGGLGRRDWVAASPDGRLLARVDTNGVATIWDPGLQERIAEIRLDPPPMWPWVAFSPDGRLLAVSSSESRDAGGTGPTVLWEFGRQQVHRLPEGDYYRPLFSSDGRLLAAGSGTDVRLWTVPDLRPLNTLKGHTWTVRCMALFPGGSSLASSGRDRDMSLWDVASGKRRALFSTTLQNGLSASGAFSPDGRTLASGEHGTLARLWNVATGRPLFTIKRLVRHRNLPMFSPDGNLLAIGGSEQVGGPPREDLAETDPVEVLQAPSLEEIDAAEKASAQEP